MKTEFMNPCRPLNGIENTRLTIKTVVITMINNYLKWELFIIIINYCEWECFDMINAFEYKWYFRFQIN
ncbi:hypothetical protein VCHA48O428_40192 [Vibrio chagasii]|nr:hypothetical protein VCHA48O428_40192 [Vibrio chagasii]